MAEAEKESLGIRVVAWAIIVANVPTILFAIDGLKTLADQVIGWLKTGHWKPQSLWDAITYWGVASHRPATGWYVPDAILNYFLDGSRWFWMLALALVYMLTLAGVVILLGFGFERIEKRFKRQAPTG